MQKTIDGKVYDVVLVADPVTGNAVDPSGSGSNAAPATEETLASVLTQLQAINGNTDLVETLQDSTNTSLTTLKGYVDSVESLLETLGGNTDQVEALLNTLGVQTDRVEPLLEAIKAAIEAQAKLSDTQPVSLAEGAATESKQDAIVSAIGTPMQQTGGSVSVDNFPSSQIVKLQDGSGNDITSSSGALNVNFTGELPLPTGAASDNTLYSGLDSIAKSIQGSAGTNCSVWVDDTVTPHAYYIRVDFYTTFDNPDHSLWFARVQTNWYTADGTDVSADITSIVANLRPAGEVVASQGGSSSAVSVSNFPATQSVAQTGVQRTPSLTTATASGTIAAGAVEVSFYNNGSTSVTVAGGTLAPGIGCSFSARVGDTLGAIAYTISGGSLMITTLV